MGPAKWLSGLRARSRDTGDPKAVNTAPAQLQVGDAVIITACFIIKSSAQHKTDSTWRFLTARLASCQVAK